MPTRNNEKAVAQMKDAEKRAQRKLRRLQKKGVRVGSITPLEIIDTSNTRQVNNYIKRLENFISRKTRFVAGAEGTPISGATLKRYKKAIREANKNRDRFWKRFYGSPYLSGSKQEGTIGEVKSSFISRFWQKLKPNVEKLRSEKSAQTAIKALEKQASPAFFNKRANTFGKNIRKAAKNLNDERIKRALRGLTTDQLMYLQDGTNFAEVFYTYLVAMDSPKKGTTGISEEEHEGHIEHLLLTIEQVKSLV